MMDIFSAIDKLITEHGSASIMKERLELLRDQFALLKEQMALLEKNNGILTEENMTLKKENELFKTKLAKYTESPYGICPYCQQPSVKLDHMAPHHEFDFAIDVYSFKCENCGKEWSKDVRRLQ